MKLRPSFAAIALATLAVAGCGSAADTSSTSADTPAAPAATTADAADLGPKVRGEVELSTFASGDKEALHEVKRSNAWCRWNDGQVEMHIRFVNRMGAHVTVHVQPNYRLKGAGLHGDCISSIEDVGIEAGATRDWTKRLGEPAGVDGAPRITECAPEINSIDLG